MRILSSSRDVRRAERRLLRHFFAVMFITALVFFALVALDRLFGWW